MPKKPIAVVKKAAPADAKARVARKAKKTETHIIVLIDKSGSMQSIRHDTVAGFNAFLEEQQKLPGKASMSLYQFDTYVNKMYSRRDVREIDPLNHFSYNPGGGTAYYDALGQALIEFAATPPHVKTVLVVITDGEDLNSKVYNKQMCKNLIQSMEQNAEWEVLFMGSNLEASREAESLGIAKGKFAAFAQGGKGAIDALRTASVATAAYRGFSTQVGGVMYDSSSFADGGVGLNALYTSTAAADPASFQVGGGITPTMATDATVEQPPVKKTKKK